MIDEKIANEIKKDLITSSHNSSEAVINETKNIEHNKEIAKEKYISPEKRQNLIDDLRLIY